MNAGLLLLASNVIISKIFSYVNHFYGVIKLCLAFPAKVIDIKDLMATVELSGVKRDVSLMLLPETKLGDYVLVHAGFAMQTVQKQDVDDMLALFDEMDGAPRSELNFDSKK